MSLPWLLVVLLALLLLGALAAWAWERGRLGRRSRGRLRVAASGELGAEGLLRELGYTVEERQVSEEWSMWVDGVEFLVGCRADLLVSRGEERFVAEVKTGTLAPDPLRPATRRQLLEYLFVFDVDGVLLVDMQAGEVREVQFDV
jgi:hypothetical protein